MKKLGRRRNLRKGNRRKKEYRKVIRVLQNQELLAAKMKRTKATGAL